MRTSPETRTQRLYHINYPSVREWPEQAMCKELCQLGDGSRAQKKGSTPLNVLPSQTPTRGSLKLACFLRRLYPTICLGITGMKGVDEKVENGCNQFFTLKSPTKNREPRNLSQGCWESY